MSLLKVGPFSLLKHCPVLQSTSISIQICFHAIAFLLIILLRFLYIGDKNPVVQSLYYSMLKKK